MKKITSKLLIFTAILTVSLLSISASAQKSGFDQMALEKKVKHEILMLPYYDVFDFVQFNVSSSGTVTLSGSVNEYSTRKDAEYKIKKLAGVSNVVNNIEVLPLSNFDNELRQRTFYALARQGGLAGYLQGPNPAMHIIVSRGRITLAGSVRNSSDANLAYVAARGVSGAFEVTNALVSEKDRNQ
jgi:hyperosmotically inducible protein